MSSAPTTKKLPRAYQQPTLRLVKDGEIEEPQRPEPPKSAFGKQMNAFADRLEDEILAILRS